jgi:hypothetical protein
VSSCVNVAIDRRALFFSNILCLTAIAERPATRAKRVPTGSRVLLLKALFWWPITFIGHLDNRQPRSALAHARDVLVVDDNIWVTAPFYRSLDHGVGRPDAGRASMANA